MRYVSTGTVMWLMLPTASYIATHPALLTLVIFSQQYLHAFLYIATYVYSYSYAICTLTCAL